MSSSPSTQRPRVWTLVVSLMLLWIAGLALRITGVAIESIVVSHIASMILFSPFVAICILAALTPNLIGIRIFNLAMALIVSAASFAIWNSVMLGISKATIPGDWYLEIWSTVRHNAIHWVVFFCSANMTLKVTQWILPIGIGGKAESWQRPQWSISDLLFFTLITAVFVATLCISSRSTVTSSIVSATRGGVLLSLFFTALVMASRASSHRMTWVVLLLFVCTTMRFFAPWLDQQIAYISTKPRFRSALDINPWGRSPLDSFLESIVQVGLLVMMMDTLKLSRSRRLRDEEASRQVDRNQESHQ